MKRILLTLLAVAAVACGAKPSRTVLTGKLPSDKVGRITVEIPDLGIDTAITLSKGSFKLGLPTDITVMGVVSAGSEKANFVPDGSALTLVWQEDDMNGALAVRSASSGGVTSRLNEIGEWMSSFFENYPNAEDQDAEFEKYVAKLTSLVKDNPDNVLGLMGIQSLRGQLEPDEMAGLIAALDPKLQERKEIARMKESLDAAVKTGEGTMFVDFEAVQPDGKTRRLSDYVGRGKYILVDFWASWCGPCRREIPNVKAVWKKYHGASFDVVSVAVWDKPEKTAKALAEEKMPWAQIVNAQDVPTGIYGIEGIPHLILFGPDGTILRRGDSLRGESLGEVIAGYLK